MELIMNYKNFLYTVSLFVSASLFAAEPINAKWDPGFSNGTKWWKDLVQEKGFRPGVSISKDQGINGSGALVIDQPKFGWSGVFARTLWIVEPGKSYTIRFKYKADIKAGDFKARIRFWTNCVQRGMWTEGKKRLKQELTTPRIKQSSTGNEWKNYEYTFKIPAEANGIHLELSAGNMKGRIVVDDVEIFPADQIPAQNVSKPAAEKPVADNRLNSKWDPNFEEGSKWWRDINAPAGNFSPGVRIEAGAGENNSGGLVLENPKKNWSGVFAKTIYMVEPGQKYLLEARYNSAITSGRAVISIRFWQGCVQKGLWADGKKRLETILRSPRITKPTNGEWTTLRFPFTVPKDANGIHLEISSAGLKGRVVFDDIKITLDDGKLSIPYLSKAPDFQKGLDRFFLQKAVRLTDFVKFPTKENAVEKTEIYLGMTGDTLFGTALLYHPGRTVKIPAKTAKDVSTIFRNESIEFFITQTGRTDTPYYHHVFDVGGNILDGQEMNRSWNGNSKSWGGKVSNDCSYIQFAIPLSDIGYNENAERGLVKLFWKLNISRNHTSGKRVYTTWTPLNSSFHEIRNFRLFHGEGKNYGQILSSLSIPSGGENNSSDDIYWKTTKRLYKELFTDKKPFQGKNSVTVWHHPTHPRNVKNALQFGYQYSVYEILDEYKKYNLHPDIRMSGNPPEVMEWCKKNGIGAMLYFAYYNHDYKAIYKPSVRQKLIAELETFLQKNDGAIMGVRMGDEVLSHYDNALIRKNRHPAYKNDKEFQAVLEKIKRDYGFGKFGLPSSEKSDNEPFQWLATRKYCLDVMLDLQKELFRITRKYKQPDGSPLVCKSWGGTEWMHLLQPSRFAPYVDVMNVQSNPQYPQRPAFMAKYMKDLSGKPVWGICHPENTYGSFGSEKTAAIFSQLVRGGATGLEHWPSDWRGYMKKKGGTIFCRYGHRPRWDTTLDISKRIQTMPLLKFPKEDFAFFLSCDTVLSKRWNHMDEEENLFSLLGPAAGTWFRFISDTQLLENTAKLTDWKTVVIAKAHILDPKLAPKFKDFLEKGGTLICIDPEVYHYSPDASIKDHLAKELFGAERATLANSTNLKMQVTDHSFWKGFNKTVTLPVLGSAKYKLLPEKGTTVLVKFSDGSAAVTMKSYPNGGKAVLMATPVIRAFAENSAWVDLTKFVAKKLNCAVDTDIWNFNFPYTPEKKPVFANKCLTGNHFYWWRNNPVKDANAELNGSYTLSLLPDHLKNGKHSGTFQFKTGNLTNRIAALDAGDIAHDANIPLVKKGTLRMDQFADTWTSPDAFEVIFKFRKAVQLSELTLCWQGELPDFSVRIPDAKEIKCKGEMTDQALVKKVILPGKRAKEITILFGKRKNVGKLTLSEVELWGKE